MANSQIKNANMINRAWVLSLTGFIPFGGLAFLIFLNGMNHHMSSLFIDMFKIWSAIILSFLGGIRWGAVIMLNISKDTDEINSSETAILYFSVMGSIVALFTLLLPDFYAIPVLMICFCLQGVWDSFSAMSGALPGWMGKLRITLTVLVVAAHALVFFVLA